jgi:antitoxin PrlF
MSTAKLTTKGQITIPKPIREALGVDAGDRVVFLVREDGVVEMRPRTRDLLSLAGMLTPLRRGISVEEMELAVAEAATEGYGESDR